MCVRQGKHAVNAAAQHSPALQQQQAAAAATRRRRRRRAAHLVVAAQRRRGLVRQPEMAQAYRFGDTGPLYPLAVAEEDLYCGGEVRWVDGQSVSLLLRACMLVGARCCAPYQPPPSIPTAPRTCSSLSLLRRCRLTGCGLVDEPFSCTSASTPALFLLTTLAISLRWPGAREQAVVAHTQSCISRPWSVGEFWSMSM